MLQFNRNLSVLSEILDVQTLKQTKKNWRRVISEKCMATSVFINL